MFEKKECYTPAEAKRAYDQLDHLVAKKTLTPRQAGAHRRHIASRVRVSLRPAYNPQAARRAKSDIVKLTEAGTITMKSAAAYRAHITNAGVYVQGISAYAPHPNAAKLWMEHLYSDEGQIAWLKGYCHPIRFNDLVSNHKVPIDLLNKLQPVQSDGTYADPVFPTLEEQIREQEIITKGWDSVVGVEVQHHYVGPSVLLEEHSRPTSKPQ